jgi:hypothetical protein
MALQRMTIDGYGQLELNNVVFPRDGAIEAQCALSTADFSSSSVAENGMLLAVDKVANKVKKPTDGSLPIALNYSTEHMYDERKLGLKNFKLTPDDFRPRLGYLKVGEIFTTNTIAYDTATYADDSALVSALEGLASTAVYGAWCSNGAIQAVSTFATGYVGPKLKAVKKTTMPDGQLGVKFQVIG